MPDLLNYFESTVMIQKETNEYLELLDRIKSKQKSRKFNAILGIGKNGDILTNSISGDLNLSVITEDDVLLYRIKEVLILASEDNDLVSKYRNYGYSVFVMK